MKKILLIAGHGAGDPGATAGKFREADETRRVVAALRERLGCGVYPSDRNAYEDAKKGTLRSVAQFQSYDFVLEIHFNAFQQGGADGRTKGVEAYVPKGGDRTVAAGLCRAVAACGLSNRGVKEGNFAVIRAAGDCGVPACLLEVCFLDDPDDMAVYTEKFDALAAAVAGVFGAVADGGRYQRPEDVPDWGRRTVEKLVRRGWLRGDGDGLDLDRQMLRLLVLHDRAGLYDERSERT